MSDDILSQLKQHNRDVLALIGEDPDREGLVKTPERVAKAMLDLTRGYNMDPVATLNSAKFQEPYNQMVIVRDIEFYSLCEHHMLPFYGKATWPTSRQAISPGSPKLPVSSIFMPTASRCRNDSPCKSKTASKKHSGLKASWW